MKLIIILYVLNSTLLILHEIESGFKKEWELLKLPGKITGFLLIHIPIIILLFYGLLEIEKNTKIGLILGIIIGICGTIPLLIHKIIIKKSGYFDLVISNLIIYLNTIVGVGTTILSIIKLVNK